MLTPIRKAIKSIYGVDTKGVYVKLDNQGPSLERKLKAEVDKFASVRVGEGKGDPLMVVNAKGGSPYDGYAVTIVDAGKGRLGQRFPTAFEMAEMGFDMW